MKKKHGGKLSIPPRRNVVASPDTDMPGPGRPATAIGPNVFSPRQETSMRQQRRQANIVPPPADTDADDMGGM